MSTRTLLLAWLAALTTAAFPHPARAQDPARDPVTLQGDPAVARLKQDLVGETARLERLEALEHRRAARPARPARRRVLSRTRGLRQRPAPLDEDARLGRAPAALGRASLEAVAGLPPNVLVNDKTGDGLYSAQSEPGVALAGANGLAAWNDGQGFETGGDNLTAGITTNGGSSWTRIAIPRAPGMAAGWWKSDPAVAANPKTGDFYAGGLTNGSGSSSGLALVRGTFSGGVFTWDTVRVVRNAGSSSLVFDKPWLVADSTSGRLYLTYVTFGSSGSDSVELQVSSNRGRTWSSPLTVNVGGFGAVQGPRPAVGPSGEVYVVWQETGNWAADYLRCRKSVDGGASFGAVSTVSSVYGNFGTGAPGFNRPQGFTMPSIAVDRSAGPNRGRVYVAWNEAVNYYDDPLGGAGAKTEVESNDNFAAATPFTPGQKLRGNIATQLDLDYWSFSATQGQTYIFYCDSVAKALTYYMRVFCGADSSTRLAFSGSPFSRGNKGLIVWTAPATGTFYLRLGPNDTVGGYRVQTGVDAPSAGERSRDHRDAFVAWSDNGASWSTPVRMNDDAAGLDDWLPEIAVSTEGYPYAMWLDWRNAPANCGGQSNVYLTRSTDGGATWAPNQRVTSSSSAWSFVAANVAPNQGDYLALAGGPTLLLAWADGRLGDADVFASALPVRGTLIDPPDSTWLPGTAHVLPYTLSNPDGLFDNTWTATLSSARAWPGLPAGSAPVPVAAGGTAGVSFPVTVPDTAAVGTNTLRVVLQQANGVRLDSIDVTIHVASGAAGVAGAPGPALALRGVWPNPAGRDLHVAFSLPRLAPATLELLDLAGRRVLTREVGSLGPGAHVLDLTREAAGLAPGVYALRLTQQGRSVAAKLAILH